MGNATLHHNSGILIPRSEYEELTEALATVFRIGAKFTPRLVDRLDLQDGDPDLEDSGDDEPAGDEKDGAWIEWHQMRGSPKRRSNILPTYNEDDEEDDPSEEDDHSGQCTQDEISSGVPSFGWGGPMAAGCPIADPGIADSGAVQDAYGLDAPNYGVDQSQPLSPGHEV
ncbi:hypothetical protein [Altererythrobacter sp. TH136]|uniref:hypothetical protein n=1 Tax=Altererythrobacter sp. TH136 TaxID=2067415 RepID=UPI0011624DA5|nr:hypothetical protein [Altererythrobacter sp. TH136]QDM40358.1 hypothetical protein C0V74_04325 [Altererythrobacter sp. TH136]